MRSISLAASGGRPCGISALPLCGVISLQQIAFFRLARDNGRRPALAALQKTLQRGHLVVALGLGRLMASIAIGLKQWLDLLAVADLVAGFPVGGDLRPRGG